MMSVEKPTILVLDANQRSALAVTRSLGRCGAGRILTADSSPRSLAAASRFSAGYLRCPPPDRRPEDFLQWLRNAVSSYNIDAIFPITEITSQLVLMNREDIHCNLPFADYETVMALADKGRLLQKARSARLPVPDFSLFDRASQVDVKRFSGYPLVVKPCLSHIWTRDRWISTTVRVVNSREELSEVLRATPYLRDYPFMIQAFIPGSGAGIFALFDSGEPVTWFAHRRIREKPPRGGVSVLSESVAVDSRLKDYAEVLLRSVNWHGVAMVEFRVAEDGTPYLMEVNTRFWGSLQLAIDAGVDFPRLLWEVSTNKSVPHHDPYRVGQRLRWLLGDLDSLYLSLKDRKFSGREKLARVLGFITPGGSRCRHEVNRWDDLRPALFELRQYLRDLLGRTPNDSQAPSRYREHTIKSNSAR